MNYAYYNFCRLHASLGGKTLAQVAGIAKYRLWVEDLIALLEPQAERAA